MDFGGNNADGGRRNMGWGVGGTNDHAGRHSATGGEEAPGLGDCPHPLNTAVVSGCAMRSVSPVVC